MTKIIAIDGPPGAGKTSLIKIASRKLGFPVVPEIRDFGRQNMEIDIDCIASHESPRTILKTLFALEAARKAYLHDLTARKPEAVLVDKTLRFNLASGMARYFSARDKTPFSDLTEKALPAAGLIPPVIKADSTIWIERPRALRHEALAKRGRPEDAALARETCDLPYENRLRSVYSILGALSFRHETTFGNEGDLDEAGENFTDKIRFLSRAEKSCDLAYS